MIVTPGSTYSTDMPVAGQSSIVTGQGGRTGVIFTEWAAYEVMSGRYTTLSPLLLFPRTSGNTSTLTFVLTSSGHPIWNGLPSTFTTTVSLGSNTTSTLSSGAVEVASCSQCGGIGVAAKDPAGGRIVQIAHAAGYTSTWYSDTNLTKMMANAALWAARCN